MHSFDASTLNFGEVVQHISPLNNYYWHFLIPPSGRPQVQKGVGYWSPAAKVPKGVQILT